MILSVLRNITDSATYGVLTGPYFFLFSIDEDPAGLFCVCSVDDSHQLRSPGAHQPRKAQNFSLMKTEGNIRIPISRQMLHTQHFLPDFTLLLGVALIQFPSGHHGYQLLPVDLRNLFCIHKTTVPHDRDAVGNLKQLLQPVGYVNNSDSPAF